MLVSLDNAASGCIFFKLDKSIFEPSLPQYDESFLAEE
ncbi:hypothetical protein swp_3567 [Shewanella piezotolerans WP3]|uniref:Uncharacterized protein n=1 Tax=Shewanella piezotolerans (strain WP3 / JCM 13877) TaxID=225849 RepID=B8CQC9_SHEPW|nr:hypothetical protein swp_3567 [Shewanella piezotolerans WP3]